MPGGDRTGPAGLGPMTGRGAGFCAGYPVPGFMNPGWGRGGGRGWGHGGGGGGGGGGGWRHRHRYYASGLPGWQRAWMADSAYAPPLPATFGPMMTKEQELEALKHQATYFEQALEQLRDRIREVDPSVADSKTK
ncbi:MAG: DUF5320 domain-containing protein [Polyangiaceae bacterium]|nr:DUF5320 domain-containing protein [Polyangiaceae bacterium]